MPTSYTNAVFRTSIICLKINAIFHDAIETSSILRMSFIDTLLNSHFTNSTEDEVLSKIHIHNKVTATQKKTSLFCKLNEETQPFIEGYLS